MTDIQTWPQGAAALYGKVTRSRTKVGCQARWGIDGKLCISAVGRQR